MPSRKRSARTGKGRGRVPAAIGLFSRWLVAPGIENGALATGAGGPKLNWAATLRLRAFGRGGGDGGGVEEVEWITRPKRSAHSSLHLLWAVACVFSFSKKRLGRQK